MSRTVGQNIEVNMEEDSVMLDQEIAEARRQLTMKKVQQQKKQVETLKLFKEQMAELDRSEAFDADQHLGNSQDNLNSEIRALRAEIAALKAERAQNIVVTPVKKPGG